MPLNFPNSPSLNDTYSFGSKTWKWNGNAWALSSTTLSTSNVEEGVNLYYTESRANTAIDNRVTKSFVDALDIDADTANIASNISVTVSSTNANYRVPFLLTTDTANGQYQVGVDSGIYYNPSLNFLVLTGGSFIGSISGTTGSFSSYVRLTGDDDYVVWGAGQDTKMFYDGINNTMELELETDAQSFIITDNGTTRFAFNKSNALFTASDVTASGNITSGNVIIDGLTLKNTDNQLIVVDAGGNQVTLGGGVNAPTFDSALSSSVTEIFRFDKTVYRGGKALITLNDSPNYKIEELLFIHDGANVFINRPFFQTGYFLRDYVVESYTGVDFQVMVGVVTVSYSANIVGDNVIVYGAAVSGSPTAKGSINYIDI